MKTVFILSFDYMASNNLLQDHDGFLKGLEWPMNAKVIGTIISSDHEGIKYLNLNLEIQIDFSWQSPAT